MKKFLEFILGMALAALMLLLFTLVMLATSAHAQSFGQASDGYVSAQDGSIATNFNQVAFLGSPTKSIRLLSVYVNADTNNCDMQVFAGTTPYTVTGIINSTNLVVSSNSGVRTNELAILQFGATNWIAKVLFTNNATNVFLDSGTQLGITVPTNAVLWTCANRLTQRLSNVGPLTFLGEAFFVAQVRAPLALRLTPVLASGSNRIHAVVKYGLNDAVVAAP